jgi:hypothetical protein
MQAQIAFDLLAKRSSLNGVAAGLWLLGFPVPLEAVKPAFEAQLSSFYRRVRGRSRDTIESGLWSQVERFVKRDARVRGGSVSDGEGQALYALSGGMLELLFGAGDDAPEPGDEHQWAVDTATELFDQIEYLAPLSPWRTELQKRVPPLDIAKVEDAAQFFLETASLPRQLSAVRTAKPHDWLRARRVVTLLANRLDRAAASVNSDHQANRALFARLTVGWSRLLFPVLLSVVRKPAWRAGLMPEIFEIARQFRRRPSGRDLGL